MERTSDFLRKQNRKRAYICLHTQSSVRFKNLFIHDEIEKHISQLCTTSGIR